MLTWIALVVQKRIEKKTETIISRDINFNHNYYWAFMQSFNEMICDVQQYKIKRNHRISLPLFHYNSS